MQIIDNNTVVLPPMYRYTCRNCGNQFESPYDWQNINKCVKCGETMKREKLPQTYNVYD